ncbi:hypothetical protein FRX31_012513 [Thalictrum thalictroides]|uniref:RNase H type-1 domain-containing protein n=1 Tax=Thalictrum thalictroides TaxID=46969 RepID=A0A7J6WP44_THATH|nr:hypothetical protein FRX31_012513 [Thalictrum thalictroides]
MPAPCRLCEGKMAHPKGIQEHLVVEYFTQAQVGYLKQHAYGGMGVGTCYYADFAAIIDGVKIAAEQGWSNLWVEADSKAAIKSFQTNTAHWKLKAEWEEIKRKVSNVLLTVIRRQLGKPPYNLPIENTDTVYYRLVQF